MQCGRQLQSSVDVGHWYTVCQTQGKKVSEKSGNTDMTQEEERRNLRRLLNKQMNERKQNKERKQEK